VLLQRTRLTGLLQLYQCRLLRLLLQWRHLLGQWLLLLLLVQSCKH
jgi:hypothetical protein